MNRPARPSRFVLTTTLAAGLLAAACTGSSSTPPSSAPPSSTSSSPAPSTSSKPAPPPAHHAAKNPFTGIGPVPKSPVVAVKIDDTAPGRPQVGIDKADVVYIEAVEGGLTRLAAIFGTTKPRAVGYVRSTRPSDPDLLLQYGKITEAYSGGAHDSLPRVHRSGITSWSNDAGARFYTRANRSQSSYINLVLNVARVAQTVKTTRPRSIGWTFSPTLKGIPSRKAPWLHTVVTGSYQVGTAVDFKYDRKLGKYVRYIGGAKQHAADGKPIAAENVIVQSCKVVAHRADTDVLGNPSQFTYTVGTGHVTVFRNGRRIEGTWSRKKLSSGTTLRTNKGKAIPLAPGNTWVVLIRKGVATKS